MTENAWQVKPDGKTVKVYKDGDLYTTKTVVDVSTYQALMDTAPKGFKLWSVFVHYLTTGEKEFRL